MREAPLSIAVFTLTFTISTCHLIWNEPKQLHPVQGLYVKPSIDGTTGDLYVAATEDNGVKTEWLTDQPINFLPPDTKKQSTAVPVSLASSVTKTTPNEETITKKTQAVVASPPLQYAFALPLPGSDGNILTPYPYAVAPESSHKATCSESTPVLPYSAFQYFYPQMLSSIASAMNTLNGDGHEKGSGISPLAAQFWSSAYSYPYQYVMVDPNAWAQSQKDTLSSTSSETS